MPRSEHHAVKVVHRLPHRTRIRMPKVHRTPGKMEKMGDRLSKIEGVKGVSVDHRTGSILLEHHEDPSFIEGLMASLEEAGDLFLSVMMEDSGPESELSIVSRFLKDTLGSANANVSASTRGFIDLRMIVPLSFLGAAIWKIRHTKEWMIEVPPYVLLYYAFDSYMKLHHPKTVPDGIAAGPAADGE
ncbi:MAG: hypothetical protein JSS86_20300 [Cyanobacteria bacterium SZAS LIN-2]|nr:hypothetical protein [Cyanobacteria bacterium SZAS LIN-3]MBS1998682.1 hypothetical protein [Cyanobacteria bacterium SZAS LIN-2]MBS2008476.1 hypothetical protein [Cyanobacteria bacterium SZAS TMP-1]